MSRAARTGTGVQAGAATSGGLLFTYGGIVVGPALFGALARVAGFGAALLALGALVAARLVGTPLRSLLGPANGRSPATRVPQPLVTMACRSG
ncbi:hypothetical protein [Methylobacterium persicinum]|uniref:Major facilitator superfamily (MFS) profile domain-containing protein n=1 Tax=Methylobacterium persicinum TaxID=374426 RepID=A0ABU0HM14_9HYPH|nr:hypothetical protein [Methylobacterium persicinum]MDQ0443356.1 hypothetical protein [Methylobacterium persicinum]GJE37653.1 hypothetical protein KHHGKMAE_1713 [Methylobacterium persicinum]